MLVQNINVCLVLNRIDNVSGQKRQIWLIQMFQTQVRKSPPNNPESVDRGILTLMIFSPLGDLL